jgi:hypothetical protein
MFERERTGQHVRGAGVDTRVVDMRVGVDKGVGRAHKQVGNAIAGHVHAAVQAGAQCCGITRGSEHPHALVGGQVDVRIGCRGVAEEQVHGSVVVVGGLFTDSKVVDAVLVDISRGSQGATEVAACKGAVVGRTANDVARRIGGEGGQVHVGSGHSGGTVDHEDTCVTGRADENIGQPIAVDVSRAVDGSAAAEGSRRIEETHALRAAAERGQIDRSGCGGAVDEVRRVGAGKNDVIEAVAVHVAGAVDGFTGVAARSTAPCHALASEAVEVNVGHGGGTGLAVDQEHRARIVAGSNGTDGEVVEAVAVHVSQLAAQTTAAHAQKRKGRVPTNSKAVNAGREGGREEVGVRTSASEHGKDGAVAGSTHKSIVHAIIVDVTGGTHDPSEVTVSTRSDDLQSMTSGGKRGNVILDMEGNWAAEDNKHGPAVIAVGDTHRGFRVKWCTDNEVVETIPIEIAEIRN